jgi:hypothetical protein
MGFTADHYYRTALERMSQAHRLYREGAGSYALAMYAAGVAVESLMRAFLLRRGKAEFESRHNVLLLAKESGILDVDRDLLKSKGLTEEQIDGHVRALWASVNDVFILWRNAYRFASEDRLRAHLSEDEIVRERAGRSAQGERPPAAHRSPALYRQGGAAMAAALRKLRRILEEQFPPPDKVDLRDEDGIIGVVTSRRFRRLDTMRRQDLIHDILATHLSPPERRRVVLIVAVTPEEELANAGDDDV